MIRNEKDILCALIDYLEDSSQWDFLSREVPFVYRNRRVDLLGSISNIGGLTAFEIKSDVDSLSRLEKQLEDYRQVFSTVYVVTTEKFIDKIKKYGLWYGILLVENTGKLVEYRKARTRKKLNEKMQLEMLDVKYLKMKCKSSNSSLLDKDALIQEIYKAKSDQEIAALQKTWLINRYKPLYMIFQKERITDYTTIKDLDILALRSDEILV